MNTALIQAILESLAVGDSLCKCTEFASRSQIIDSFKEIKAYLKPEDSLAHKDMLYAQITDDTEQNLFLLNDYIHSESITPELAAQSLCRWFDETPDALKYIGPSSLNALKAIKNGEDLYKAGVHGTSCGGIMRVPAAFLCSTSLKSMEHNIECTLYPTHNTNIAMEAAMGYGYTLFALASSNNMDTVTEQAVKGCTKGRRFHPESAYTECVPSCEARIKLLLDYIPKIRSDDAFLDFLFYCLGTTISSCDVFTSSFGLFCWCKNDVYKAIRLSAMLGGDTDTIGCLSAVLCCMYAGGHNIPHEIISTAAYYNHIDFHSIALEIYNYRIKKGDKS